MTLQKPRRLILYKNSIFVIDEMVHSPDNYSFFLEDNLCVEKEDKVLDLGTGCGFLCIQAALRGAKAVGVDISSRSIHCAQINSMLNGVEDSVEFRAGDLYDVIQSHEKFDVVLSWPPLLPTPPDRRRSDWIGTSNEGGDDGRAILDRVIVGAPRILMPNGRLQFLHPWYLNIEKTFDILSSVGLVGKITADAIFPMGILSFERLSYIESLGFDTIKVDGIPQQKHLVITANKI